MSEYAVNQNSRNVTWLGPVIFWFFLSAIPLFFVFTYSRSLFANIAPQKRHQRFAVVINGLGLATTAVPFPFLAQPVWKNAMVFADSWVQLVMLFIVLSSFLITGLFF